MPFNAIARAGRSFSGVPHRLEVVGRALGAVWVNDSIATSPERTMAALRSFSEPVVLLLGGRDKNLALDGLREFARSRCRAVICFGEAGALFQKALAEAVPATRVVQLLDEADKFYDVLLERVGKQIAQGKSLEEIKKNPDLPEYKSWTGGKSRLDTNIEAAYRALKK